VRPDTNILLIDRYRARSRIPAFPWGQVPGSNPNVWLSEPTDITLLRSGLAYEDTA